MPYNEHLKKWEDLVTTQEATRKGFISIAFEKNIKGTPFIEEAKRFIEPYRYLSFFVDRIWFK